jgi:hypothetical protein
MQKIRLLLIFVLLSLLTLVLISREGFNSSKSLQKFDLVVSTDGTIEPGLNQDFMVYPLIATTSPSISPAKLIGCFEVHDQRMGFSTVSQSENLSSHGFPARFRLKVPENFSNAFVYFNVYEKNLKKKMLLSERFEVKTDLSIAVTPPDKPLYCGEWLNLKLIAFNKRTLKGLYKIPIRVKMQTPFDLTTINRVISTEVDGTCNFTAFINPNSPQGLYRFEISHGFQTIMLTLPLLSADKKNISLTQPFNSYGISISPGSKQSHLSEPATRFKLRVPPQPQLFSDLKLGNQQLSFSFDCTGSSYRSVEIWQNGQLVNQSDLPILKGRTTHPLPRGLNPALPINVKVWMHTDNKILTQEQSLMQKAGPNSIFENFFQRLEKALSADSNPVIQTFLKPQSTIKPSLIRPQTKAAPNNANIIIEPSEHYIEQFQQTLPVSDSMRFLDLGKTSFKARSKFVLVESEVDLRRFNFDRLKIHLSPEIFFKRFIAAIYSQTPDIDGILSEAEARTIRFNLLTIIDQETELQKLEGLLIPISEFLIFSQAHLKTLEERRKRAFRVISHMSGLIHVPEQFAPEMIKYRRKQNYLGPAGQTLDFTLNENLLLSILKTGGKIRLETVKSKFPINLSNQIIDQKNRDFSGNRRLIEKLINLRTDPVLLELIY